MKRIYLDNAAATQIDPIVSTEICRQLAEVYGNPSSIHQEGLAAKRVLAKARADIALLLEVHADEVVFTGSATESCNLAIFGSVRAWQEAHPDRTPHVIVSSIEHDAVLASVRELLSEGVTVTYAPVDQLGQIDVNAIEQSITIDTVLISIGYANNEIGTIAPVTEIARMIRRWKKEVRHVTRDVAPHDDERYPLFHTDACQAANYLSISVPKLGVDMLTLNAAKIYGPKGVALLVRKRDIVLTPVIVGGGHEMGLRAGTENVPYIAGFALALAHARDLAESETVRLSKLRERALAGLRGIDGLIQNGVSASNLPNIVNFSVPNISHEFLAIALDARGFAVSTKSACNEAEAETSHVLQAIIDAGHNGAPSGIRLSFGRHTTNDDIDEFIASLRGILSSMIVML